MCTSHFEHLQGTITSLQIARLTRQRMMEDKMPKTTKTHTSKLAKPIILLASLGKDELEALEYIEHTCHNTSGNTTSGKYLIQISRFDSGTPEQ